MGWRVTMAGANFERSGIAYVAEARRDLEDLVQFCKESGNARRARTGSAIVRHRLADLAVSLEAARQWGYYCVWMQGKNPLTIVEPSAAKYFGSEYVVRLANTGVKIMGMYGALKRGSKWAPLHGKSQSICQSTLGLTIAMGSTEIQKNLLAWVGLGLPRK